MHAGIFLIAAHQFYFNVCQVICAIIKIYNLYTLCTQENSVHNHKLEQESSRLKRQILQMVGKKDSICERAKGLMIKELKWRLEWK